MRFFRYWTRADVPISDMTTVTGWGFSDISLDDARRVAQGRAQILADMIKSGRRPRDRYYGGDRPLREEVLEEITHDGEVAAVISRNSYGARVLNTDKVFFADIDLPRRRSLFRRQRESRESFEADLVQRVQRTVELDEGLRVRLYRTAGGYRAIITSQLVEASDARASRLLHHFGSDQLYVALCRTQDSYRARLSPKPWRMKISRPPVRFPYGEAEAAFRSWEYDYEAAAARFATCKLVGTFGTGPFDPFAEHIASVHDHASINDGAPLA